MAQIGKRPEFATDEMLYFLDGLDANGFRNMWNARPLLRREFDSLSVRKANKVVAWWARLRDWPSREHWTEKQGQ